MASVLCDPNYDPSQLYRHIEALLFLYDQVYLYSPSQGQMQMAGIKYSRIERLIEKGFVIPVGRGFWFDPGERETICNSYQGNEEKVTTYRWSALDDHILNLGPSKLSTDGYSRSPGYLLVADDHREYADMMQDLGPQNCPTEFEALIERATELLEQRLLPAELMRGDYVDAPIETLASRLIFHTAGDIRLAEMLGVSSVFSTVEMGSVYGAVSSSFLSRPDVSTGPRVAVIDPDKEYKLTPEEVRIAASLAEQIVDDKRIGPLDLDLLIEYRSTDCSRMFRDFVSNELQTAPQVGESDASPETRLKKVFDRTAALIDLLADEGPLAGGITIGAAGGLLLDRKLKNSSTTRRFFLTVLAALSVGALSNKVMPSMANRVSPSVITPRHDTMFAIVRRQRQRR